MSKKRVSSSSKRGEQQCLKINGCQTFYWHGVPIYDPSRKLYRHPLPPPPAPEITPASLLYSLQAFDAIVQKVVEINAGRWIFPEDAPILVRAVLKAIVEVNNAQPR